MQILYQLSYQGSPDSLPDSLPTELPGKPKSLSGQWAYFLPGVTVRMCSGVGPEGWEGRLRCFDYPSGGVECRGHAQYSAFAPNTQFCFQLFRGSSWVSWYLYSFWVQSLPQVATHSFIFSPLLFLCILLLKERCDQIQTSKHCNKGSQVPACLKRTRTGGINQDHRQDLGKPALLVAANLAEDVKHWVHKSGRFVRFWYCLGHPFWQVE